MEKCACINRLARLAQHYGLRAYSLSHGPFARQPENSFFCVFGGFDTLVCWLWVRGSDSSGCELKLKERPNIQIFPFFVIVGQWPFWGRIFMMFDKTSNNYSKYFIYWLLPRVSAFTWFPQHDLSISITNSNFLSLLLSVANLNSVKTEILEKGANSSLLIVKINKSDSGNYSCFINATHEYVVTVHVLNGM